VPLGRLQPLPRSRLLLLEFHVPAVHLEVELVLVAVEVPLALLHLHAPIRLLRLALPLVDEELVGLVEFIGHAGEDGGDLGRRDEDHGVGRLVDRHRHLLQPLVEFRVPSQLFERVDERFGRNVHEPQDDRLDLGRPMRALDLIQRASRSAGGPGGRHRHGHHQRYPNDTHPSDMILA